MEITVPDGMLMNEALIEQLTTQMLDAFARKAHTHSQSDITGLETALAGFLKESDLDARIKFIDYGEINGDDLPYDQGIKGWYYSIPASFEIGATKIITAKLSSEDGLMSERFFGLRLPSGGIYLVWGNINRKSKGGLAQVTQTSSLSYAPTREEGQAIIYSSNLTEYYKILSDEFSLFITRLA